MPKLTNKDKAELLALRIWSAQEIREKYGFQPKSWGQPSNKSWCSTHLPKEDFSKLKLENEIVRCELPKGHTGPHIDYNLSDRTLIWTLADGKLMWLNEGEDSE